MIRIATLDDETQWLTTERIITEQCFESGDYSFYSGSVVKTKI